MSRLSRLPGLPARHKLGLVNKEAHSPRACVNPDQVAIANQR